MNQHGQTEMASESGPFARLERTDLVFVLSAMAATAVLGLLLLDRRSLWLDEIMSITMSRDWDRMLEIMAGREANMWLYYSLLHGWLKLGDSEFVVRGLSVIFSILTVPAVYGLGRVLFGSTAARMAVAILPVNAFFIHYAQEARAYSLLIFLSALSGYFFTAALRRPAQGHWVGYVLTGALSIYAHLFGALNLAVQAAALAASGLGWRRWLRWILSWGAMALLLLPLPLFHRRLIGSSQIDWVGRPDGSVLFRLAEDLAGGRTSLLYAYALLCFLALGLAIRSRQRDHAADLWPQTFLWLWLLLPPLATYLFSVWVKPVFIPRYLAACLVPFVLLAGLGLASLPAGKWRNGALGVAIALSLSGLVQWYTQPPHEDWRGAAASVAAQARTGDAAIFFMSWTRQPFDYYFQRLRRDPSAPVFLSLPPWKQTPAVGSKPTEDILAELPQKYDRVWLILSHHDLPGTGRAERADLMKTVLAHGYGSATVEERPGVEVRLYAR